MQNYSWSPRIAGVSGMAVAIVGLLLPTAVAGPGNASGDTATPVGVTQDVKPLAEVRLVETAPIDLEAVWAEDDVREQAGMAPRYAIPNEVMITPDTDGTWEDLENGYRVWRLRIASPGAASINLGFTRYNMPPGGQLLIYSADYRSTLRPFTSDDNAAHNELWTPPLLSAEIVVELTIPANEMHLLDLELTRINHGYRGFGAPVAQQRSGSCNVDVVCPEGDGWRDEIAAVAVISTGGSTFCTGFMVNNAAQDLTPYFMTANHCGISSGNAASLVAFWNYENSWCRPPGSGASGGPGDGTLTEFNTGSFFRASYGPSDMTLVELDSDPDPTFEVAFAGWDRSGADATSAIAIHHPNTDEKRISFENDPTTVTTYLQEPIPGDGTHVRITDWDLGTTEPGSSGSPLFNQDHQIIGQLHGGFASCTSQTSDWYGRFFLSWTGGGSNSTRLSNWLDAGGTGALFVDTIPGGGMIVDPAGNVEHLGLVGGPFTNPSVIYTLTNPRPDPIDYEVSLTASFGILLDGGTATVAGTLAGSGGTAQVTVTLGAPINSLPQGTFVETINFDDLTNGRTLVRVHTVEAGTTGFTTDPDYGLEAGGPVGGPFAGTVTYTLTSTRPAPVDVLVAQSASWISVNGSTSDATISLNGIGDSAAVQIGFSTDANSLPPGIATGSVSFSNLMGGAGDTARPVILDVGRFSYSSQDTPIAINDNSTISSRITVNDAFCIGDVDVPVDITHTYIGDLILNLESPEGTVVRLHNRTGGSADDIVETYDDAGFAPDGPGTLADFNSEISTGTWTLTVSDNAGQDTGSLNSWQLKVAAGGPGCDPTASNMNLTLPHTTASDITLQAVSPDGNPLNYVITSLPGDATLSDPNGGAIGAAPYTLLSNGKIVTYQPDPLFVGSDSFTFEVNDGVVTSNEATVSITVGGEVDILNFTLDTNPGWNTVGLWAYGTPTGGGSHNGDPTSGFTGSNVYGYNLNGDYTNNMPTAYLTTGSMDLSGVADAKLEFRRWLGVESNVDNASVEVSNNGTTWVPVWQHTGAAISESSWSLQEYDISAVADNQSTVFVRWGMGPMDSSITYPGWNIDDIKIKGILPPIQGLPGDLDFDGDVDLVDYLTFTGCFSGAGVSEPPPGCNPTDFANADMDNDVDVDLSDFLTFSSSFGT